MLGGKGLEGIGAWLAQLQWDALWEMVVTVLSCVLCITFHETCHGLAAYFLGDPTAKRAGRLSLNPLKHIDVFGLVMLAVAKFGWAKPVPVDMRNFKKPKAGMAVTALAGPVGNVVLAAVALMCYSVVTFYLNLVDSSLLYYVQLFFLMTAVLSCGLAVFNLFPVPPLDGSKILAAVLPDQWYAKLMRYERYGMIVLMVLLVSGVLDTPLSVLRDGLLDALASVCFWPFDVLVGIYF